MKNILDTVMQSNQFRTLISAVEAAGMVSVLNEKGPFTMLAPTDEAFKRLPEGTVENLLKDRNRLKNILSYHVMTGKVLAKDVIGMKSAKTMQGGYLKIDTSHGIRINNARVIDEDVEATNGVIHVIDTVLMPE